MAPAAPFYGFRFSSATSIDVLVDKKKDLWNGLVSVSDVSIEELLRQAKVAFPDKYKAILLLERMRRICVPIQALTLSASAPIESGAARTFVEDKVFSRLFVYQVDTSERNSRPSGLDRQFRRRNKSDCWTQRRRKNQYSGSSASALLVQKLPDIQRPIRSSEG